MATDIPKGPIGGSGSDRPPRTIPISPEQQALAELSAACVDAGLSVSRVEYQGKEELRVWTEEGTAAVQIGVAWFDGYQCYTRSGARMIETGDLRQALQAVRSRLRTS